MLSYREHRTSTVDGEVGQRMRLFESMLMSLKPLAPSSRRVSGQEAQCEWGERGRRGTIGGSGRIVAVNQRVKTHLRLSQVQAAYTSVTGDVRTAAISHYNTGDGQNIPLLDSTLTNKALKSVVQSLGFDLRSTEVILCSVFS
ncbi:uncharacterized protein ARMOST_21390 [Armillaria ostoyae]|uniref:Uncharacterized protein n=1 Tax=Armillaria ostoyae TaxID=47428 RepID=A0A284SA22_ARMOS|nr:uncharacterized protein ARMOST_21390 [Armillaria ostoyae]